MNTYNIALHEAIERLRQFAQEAYWHDESGCGADFNQDSCFECRHYKACKLNTQLKGKIELLDELAGQ